MRRFLIVCAAVAALCSIPLAAQQGRQGAPGPRRGPAGPPPSGRAQAPFDLSGYWVSLVTDDWRYRMLTPPKGNADYLPVNNEARRVMGEWDPAKDEAAGRGVPRLRRRRRDAAAGPAAHHLGERQPAEDGPRRRDADAPLPVRAGAGGRGRADLAGDVDARAGCFPRAAAAARPPPAQLRRHHQPPAPRLPAEERHSVQCQRRASPSTSSASWTKGRNTWR